MSQEALHYIPIEKWHDIQKSFKKIGLRGIPGHAVLETQRKLQVQGYDYGFKVYCPLGDMENGIVGINDKKGFNEIIILSPGINTKKIEDALKTTKVIYWEKPVIIPFAPNHIIKSVKNALDGCNIAMALSQSETFILDKLDNNFQDVSVPPGVSFGLLSPEHVYLINSTWHHRYATSTWYFKFLIATNSGYGLYQNQELVAWVFLSESGTLLHLYTVETQRRKGLAELLLKLFCIKMIEKDIPMIAYCLKDNVIACNLYKKTWLYKIRPRCVVLFE